MLFRSPSADAAQILIRLKPDLSDSERASAIGLIRDAVGDDAFRIRGAEYVVSGAPVVVDGLADKLSSAIFVLLTWSFRDYLRVFRWRR